MDENKKLQAELENQKKKQLEMIKSEEADKEQEKKDKE